MSAAEDHKSRVSRIYDEVASAYDQVGPAFYTLIGRELVARTGLRAGERVLDAGCGRGACLFAAGEAVGPAGEVIGIDASPGMVEETSAEVARRGRPNIGVELGDAERPDFPEASFDVVLSGFVLRLLRDPAAALRSYARLLRPGGRLGATIYASSFEGRWSPVRAVLEPFQTPGPPPPVRLDPAERVTALVREAGFDDVVTVEEAFDISLTGPAQWWEYLWSSGYRGTMDRIPPERRDEARETTRKAVHELREPDGSLIMPQRVRLTTAQTPT